MTVNFTSFFFRREFLFMSLFNIVRPICCGMDVHKNLIVATIATTDQEGVTTFLQRSFTTMHKDLLDLKQWLKNNNCFEAVMESTGKYWIPVFNVLEDEIKIYIAHPKYTKSIRGKKTDKKDSRWIANLFKCDLINFSFIPPKDIRELRDICRYRTKLIAMRSSERLRYQNCMTVSNINIDSVLSNSFGKSAKAIMSEVLSSKTIDEQKISALLQRRAKSKLRQVLDALEGSHIESDQRLKMKVIIEHSSQLDKHIEEVEKEMFKRCLPFKGYIDAMCEIPGISLISAMIIISEIGTDMSVFESDKKLCGWVGLAPTNNESHNKKKSVRISKAGSYLKPVLVQCALSAIRNKGSYYNIKYNKIKKRRGHKKAIIAIARKLLVACYHILRTGETYNPCDYESITNPKPTKNTSFTVESALAFLQKQGFDTSALVQQPV